MPRKPRPQDDPVIKAADHALKSCRKKQLRLHNRISALRSAIELLTVDERNLIDKLNALDDAWYAAQKTKGMPNS